MKLLEDKEEKDFVRIVIGTAEHGKSGVKRPIMTISVLEVGVEELYNKIKDMIKKEGKKK